MWNICLWWLELKTVAVTNTFIRYSFTCVQNQSVCHWQLYCLSSRFLYVSAYPMGWIVKLGNYPCGMFPLIYCSPDNGLAFLPSIFICNFSQTGFAERSYLVEVSLSFFPSSLLSQNKSWLSHSAQRSPFTFWSYLGYVWLVQGEVMWGFFRVSEKEMSPSCQLFFFYVN